MLASVLWQCLAVPSLLQLCYESTHAFSLLSTKPAESFSAFSSPRRQDVFHHFFWVPSFHSCTLLHATLALSLVVSSLKSVCCDFSIFSAVCPDRLPIVQPGTEFRRTLTICRNQGPKVWERIHLPQLLILNEYAARYAVALAITLVLSTIICGLCQSTWGTC